MPLSIRDIASALKLPMTTIERWARQGHIPATVRKNVYFFDERIIEKWAKKHQLPFRPQDKKEMDELQSDSPSLVRAMKIGSFVYGLPGQSMNEILSNACQQVPMPSQEAQQELYHLLIEREQLTSTGIGKGVAIPHPRTPMEQIPSPLITTCFLNDPIDFKAIDDQRVFVLFILVCPKVDMHLQHLSRLAYCIRDNQFVEFLHTKPDESSFLTRVNDFEKQFEKTDPS
ncbi:MAG: PTS sugar transporter subunit IIA [Candidatus Magnetomorum sp.]|nr:PTS sugar transporter subunit IIA [Candidatus Magnetomorum sp.]